MPVQSNLSDVNMFTYDIMNDITKIFNKNYIAKTINSLSSPDLISVAFTFYKNGTTVEEQFTSVTFTDCMVVHFFLHHSVCSTTSVLLVI